MKTYRFTIILVLASPIDAMADRLFEAGCDDCTCGQQDGKVFADFDRQAETMEAAIASAVRDIKQAGYEIESISIDPVAADALTVDA